MNQCEWRDCTELGHAHGEIRFRTFKEDKVVGIYLCAKHCKQAKQTRHLDVMISQIRMETREGPEEAPPVPAGLVRRSRQLFTRTPRNNP